MRTINLWTRAAVTLLLVMLTTIGAWADQVTAEEALQQAQAFLTNRTDGSHRAPGTTPQLVAAGQVCGLYVFNTADKKGFVIVSNDDATYPILGFSESGTIDPANIPSNMRAWLQGYADEIAWLQKQGAQGKRNGQRRASRRTGTHSTTPIAPLVTCQWNQSTPYNNLCPMYSSTGRSVTGCVATAMAQVMYYHKWPQGQTTAIPGYITDSYNIDLSAGLPATTFDWDNMRDKYNGSYTTAQATAVATLMQYCGYSVKMDYGPSSGAYTQDVAIALREYFGYNGTTKFISRSSYTYDNWTDLIYFELAHNRPVVYGGVSTGGGHEFVCDGYKFESNMDFFHINWGWGGTSDEYFVLSALDPDAQGIGGSTSQDGFNQYQDAVIGIQKSTDNGDISDISPNNNNLSLNSMTLSSNPVGANTEVTITSNIQNNNTVAYEGEICLGLKTADDYISIVYWDEITIPAGGSKSWEASFKPTEEGTYDFVLCYVNGEGEYVSDGVVGASLQVVSTNGYVPIYGYYVDNFSRSQFIIPAGQLSEMTDGTLNGVTFYATDNSIDWGAAEFDVYLSEVSETTFTGKTLKDWESLDKVYSGKLSISGGTMEITFDEPYPYQGGNLLVGINQTVKGTYKKCNWVGTTATGASLGGYGTTISQQNFIPQTTFDYTSADPNVIQRPRNLTIAYTGGRTATVSWTSDAEAFDIDVNGTVTENVTSPYELTNLELATIYAVKVRAKNGSNYSEWTKPVSFTTDLSDNMCNIMLALTDSYGDGWNGAAIKVVDVLTDKEIGTFTNTNEAGKGIAQNYQVNVPDDRDIQFQWVSGNYNSECTYVAYDVNGDEIFSGSGAMSESVTYHVNCTVNPWRKPTNLTATEIGPHSAVLSWTENGEATAWVVAYKADGAADFTEVSADANPYTLTGLSTETTYTVKVRPATDEVEKWSNEITFTTDVACPVPANIAATEVTPTTATIAWTGYGDSYNVHYRVSSILFSEDFEGDVSAWTASNLTSGSQIVSNEGIDGGTCFVFKYTSNPPQYIISPELDGDTEGTTLKFSYRIKSATWTETFKVGYSTTTNSVSDFTWSEETTVDTPNEWFQYTMTLPAGVKYVSIQCTSNNQYYLYIDNVSIESEAAEWATTSATEESITLTGLTSETKYEVQVQAVNTEGTSAWSPTVFFTTLVANPVPTDLAAELTADGGTLTWTGYGDSYNVQYRTAADEEVTFYDNFENSLDGWTILEGAEATHPNSGIWYIIDPTSGLEFEAHSGDFCASSWSWNSSAYNADNWLITPQLTIGNTLKFWVRTNAKFPDSYEVRLSTGGNAIDDFTVTLQAKVVAPNNGEWNLVTIDLGAYAGQTGYIAIHHQDYDMNYLVIDDFTILRTLSPASEWTNLTAVTETTVTLSGLATNKGYEYHVQSVKGGKTSEWSAMGEFALLTLQNNATSNSDLVKCHQGKQAHVTLADRTLFKDGNWNTICLPFDVTLEGSPLEDATAQTLAAADIAGTYVTMTFGNAVTTLTAGTPYIIKWQNGSGSDIVNPVFNGVTIVNSTADDRTVSLANGHVKFIGYYDAFDIDTPANDDIYYMTSDNELKHTGKPRTLKACRAYFQFSESILSSPHHFMISFGDEDGETTGVVSMENGQWTMDHEAGAWYDLQGRRVSVSSDSSVPSVLPKGVYIHNGRKVVIK